MFYYLFKTILSLILLGLADLAPIHVFHLRKYLYLKTKQLILGIKKFVFFLIRLYVLFSLDYKQNIFFLKKYLTLVHKHWGWNKEYNKIMAQKGRTNLYLFFRILLTFPMISYLEDIMLQIVSICRPSVQC